MVMQFSNPWLLLLLIPAAAFLYFTVRTMIRLAFFRRITVIVLRSLVFLLVILLLAGLTFRNVSDKATTLFLVDSSDSVKGTEEAEAFIKAALKNMDKKDDAGIINFGAGAVVELPSTRKAAFTEMQTKTNPSFTNIEDALVLAQSLMPWDHKKRIVLISDGRENAGDALKQAEIMKSKGYRIDVFPVEAGISGEVQLEKLEVPDSLNLNEQFEISVTVESNMNTGATLRLYSGRQLTAEKKVALNKGTNRFAFSDKAVNGGTVTYRAEITADSDTVSQNNALSAYAYISDKPKILLLREYESAGKELEKILGADMQVTALKPAQAPRELPELLKYDAFVLADVSADSLSEAFLENLETAVGHQGKGLLVTGGENSYGPGGYYKTKLEEILPVNMDIKPKEEDPNLALMLVIDKSGSMSSADYGITSMDLAKEAAIRATEVLDKDDTIGVIAFDDAYKWVVTPKKLDNLQAIQDAIGTIRAGGGTQILPPLEEAYSAIQKLDTKLKHIILLTDGQAEKEGYEPVIDGLREKGITLSTVAVGHSADHALMQILAIGGKGRYYATDEFTDIPKIFAKEVFLAGKKYLNNRTFTPRLSALSDILKNIDAVPSLDGYVSTTAKETANVVFTSDEGDPVLATWQYGLGRTVAWTPDAQGIWTYDWMNWEESPLFWKNILSWLVQQNLGKGYSIETGVEGLEGRITVKAEEDSYMTAESVGGVLVGPDGTKQEIALSPSAPGEYTGTFQGGQSGVYIADLTLSDSEGKSERISTGLIIPYSPEYDVLPEDDNTLLQKLAKAGGGRILETPSQVFGSELAAVTGTTDPTLPLLITALVLFMLDIAVRRLNLNPGQLLKPLAGRLAGIAATIAARIRPKFRPRTAGNNSADAADSFKPVGTAMSASTARAADTSPSVSASAPSASTSAPPVSTSIPSASSTPPVPGANKSKPSSSEPAGYRKPIPASPAADKEAPASHAAELLERKKKWRK